MPESLPRPEPVGPHPERPAALALVAHGGSESGTDPAGRRGLPYWRMVPFARALTRNDGLAVFMLRYRLRGWNGAARDAARDADAVLADLHERHPGVPAALVGHSMGGRAVLHAAGAPGVRAVAALAPWLDGTDPVEQLAGRSLLIAHGDRERTTDPRESLAYAVRARGVTDRVARFDVLGDGHAMLRRAREWHALVTRFVLGELGFAAEDPTIADAMRRPGPDGLQVPLSGIR
ncbi:alpha/beta fold hydrolase [Pseudonocardia sp. RS11V-5]|uniref:alpha/beta hydrolase n=1 Tax=Pseudonocardia terrae TaxID=2905831 RepID=UPI001E364411|nr:alpha/beta fold hydrolase [Pseudonocardia terrae]MCE3555103.1 alpha/beta fold hydrolase [Pseudonocardia terrae]